MHYYILVYVFPLFLGCYVNYFTSGFVACDIGIWLYLICLKD